MHIKRQNWFDFEVWCQKCDTTIVVDGPEDLRKEVTDDHNTVLHLICPKCGSDIVFNRRIGIMIPDEMMIQIKNRE